MAIFGSPSVAAFVVVAVVALAHAAEAAAAADDKCVSTTCSGCVDETDCNWCTAFLSFGSLLLVTPLGMPGVCTKSQCSTLSFGTIANIYAAMNKAIPEAEIDYEIKATLSTQCNLLPDLVFDDSVRDYPDCKACVENIGSGGSKGWCELGVEYNQDGVKFAAHGGICSPCEAAQGESFPGSKITFTAITKAGDVDKCGNLGPKSAASKGAAPAFAVVSLLAVLTPLAAL